MRMSFKFNIQSFKLTLAALVMLSGLLGSSCSPGAKKAPADKSSESGEAKFVFSEEIHNFGSLKAGEVVSFTFTFKNEGTGALIIDSIDSGCECTEVKIPDQPVQPGQEGHIEVIYNSAGEVGKQLKRIILFTNSEQAKKELYIKADVKNEIIEINS